MGGTSGRKAQMKTSGLAAYVQTSEMVRAVLARDPGNAFGIWELGQSVRSYLDGVEARDERKEYEGSTMDSKEMLGWGIWPEASYFNHSCNPNVVKKRIARNLVFITTSVVQEGDELCIAYVDCDEIQTTEIDEFAAGEKRRELLRKWWFFGCACSRCSFVGGKMGEE
ncbi:hypothetical protein SERLA73DRAFT_179334 [Serpula lacrymans var. lacrymans S7.3]|uniref:SET domain-containing protein n=2 Tax=Serpula lacrymans var. lacrymans TaxID=341189 RepID=F8PS34_SERL3|nr:uncharacterized protein SERLADRAFT_464417 [Serpula lacrymans var. lacrymans S7.9]EGO01216.1 hypothetical protein SERLA73DRAFT_179334 [Serpula lacrymans var. lacrymans S7.3]EGO26865.1 hypothetical protein SERLADRAFT_464417 [Serpula lacrymans var. lacrymans S7.9]